MSYNIDSIEVLKCSARMLAADVLALSERESDLPESHFLEEMVNVPASPDGTIPIDPEKFWWSGEGSGHAWDFFKDEVAPKIIGTIEAVLTWEGGDSHTGLRVVNGKVTEPAVKMTLAD